ncbi:hypothetical protein ACLB1Q_11135 [Escherichia coli]
MHCKIVVIDARIAFIGGLNYSPSICPATVQRPNRITRCALKGRLSKIFSSLSWKTCLDRARHDAGGSITKRKRTASREKRRYCWSGAITKNIAMILNVTI